MSRAILITGLLLGLALALAAPALADEVADDIVIEPTTTTTTPAPTSDPVPVPVPAPVPDPGPSPSLTLTTTSAPPQKLQLRPFIAIVGGLAYELVQPASPADDREDRATTIALSRFGLRASLGAGVSLESEFEANAGPHGSSAWEGQASLSVRNQLVRIERGRLRVEAGRITDPSSVDYFSDHVADQLLTDGFTRGTLLASGFNRGNGVQARWQLRPQLTVGLNLNAANPVSTTSSLVVGGTFPPFSRFYFAPYQYVGRDAATLPADEYHFVMVTPSASLKLASIEAQAALQLFQVNTNTSSHDDQKIDGYNVRVGLAGRFGLHGRVHPFANFSLVQNEVVMPDDGTRLSGEIYTGTTLTAGADLAVFKRHGFGGQLGLVRDRQGDSARADQWFVNLGGTFWLAETTALGARFALFSRCETTTTAPCTQDGTRSLFFTLRTHI